MYSMMIVDDEPLMREYMKVNAPRINDRWQVTAEAMNGQDALEIMNDRHIDLIITDIKMPVIDGIELCRIISTLYPSVKLVILSGYDEFEFARKAIHYNVREYLLKPVVKNELQAILSNIAAQLDEEKSRENTYKTTLMLSEDSKKQVVRNFLKAVVMESNIEIKALYPLIYKLKISLLESVGNIVVLDLDEYVILEKSIPIADIHIYKFILHQITTELLEESGYGIPFSNGYDNTAIFLTGENAEEVNEKCSAIFIKVSSSMLKNTEIPVIGAVGIPADDVLQLNLSHTKALRALENHLLCSTCTALHTYEDKPGSRDFITRLENIIFAIQSAILDNNNTNLFISVSDFVGLIDINSIPSILKFGIFLIKKITNLRYASQHENVNIAYGILGKMLFSRKNYIETEEVVKDFIDIIKVFQIKNHEGQQIINEQEIVQKTKEFIYSHYSEPISLADIAEKIGINSSYLSNIFHKSAGESYIKFLTRIRMEQAAKLLRSSSAKKVYDVSEKVGYLSSKHFSYVFKQYYNMSPGEYQEKHM